jgi:hypothetical protein
MTDRNAREVHLAASTKAKPKYYQVIESDYRMNPEGYLSDHLQRPISVMTARHGDPPRCCSKQDKCSLVRRCVMRKFIVALALLSLIAISPLTQTANAAPVSPASSSFGSNGY